MSKAGAFLLALLVMAVSASPADALTIGTEDEQVVCAMSRTGMLCTSDVTLDAKANGIINGCGGPSALSLRARGRPRFDEICGPLYVPGTGQPITILRAGRRITRGSLTCVAKSAGTLACRARSSGHGFRLSQRFFRRY